VSRFLGSTWGSTSLRALLESVFMQATHAYAYPAHPDRSTLHAITEALDSLILVRPALIWLVVLPDLVVVHITEDAFCIPFHLFFISCSCHSQLSVEASISFCIFISFLTPGVYALTFLCPQQSAPGSSKPLLIVLDGMDQLDSSDRLMLARWLSVKVCTVVTNDIGCSLYSRTHSAALSCFASSGLLCLRAGEGVFPCKCLNQDLVLWFSCFTSSSLLLFPLFILCHQLPKHVKIIVSLTPEDSIEVMTYLKAAHSSQVNQLPYLAVRYMIDRCHFLFSVNLLVGARFVMEVCCCHGHASLLPCI
jgi:hypothetical protein